VKELVLIEDAELPFALTDKGTVRGKVTLNLYADRIEKAYEDAETKQQELAFPVNFERADILAFLQDGLRILLPDVELSNDSDLFEHGMSSSTTNDSFLTD
jgi:hypothetical protein